MALHLCATSKFFGNLRAIFFVSARNKSWTILNGLVETCIMKDVKSNMSDIKARVIKTILSQIFILTENKI